MKNAHEMTLQEQIDAAEKEAPAVGYTCPITGYLMKDPVVAPDGHTYEKAALLEWERQCLTRNPHQRATTPLSRTPFTAAMLVPNHFYRSIIEHKFPLFRPLENDRSPISRPINTRHAELPAQSQSRLFSLQRARRFPAQYMLMHLMLVGDYCDGMKTRYMLKAYELFGVDTIPRLGTDFKQLQFETNNQAIRCNIWDMAGTDRFRQLATASFRNKNSIFMMVDVTNRDSFEYIKRWRQSSLEHIILNSITCYLIATKSHVTDWRVSREELISLSRVWRVDFFEISVETNQSVDFILYKAANDFLRQQLDQSMTP